MKNTGRIKKNEPKETNMLKISFITAIVGVIGLYIFAGSISIEQIDLESMDSDGMDVNITAEITKIRSFGKSTTISLKKDSEVEAVVFDNISSLNLSKGNIITITGEVNEENKKRKIFVDTITRLENKNQE